MTDQTRMASSENGKVLAAATLVAGLVGGLSAFLSGRRKEDKAHEAMSKLLDQRRSELADLSASVETRRKELSGLLSNAGKQGRKAIKDVNASSKDFAEIDWNSLSRRARKGIDRARSEAVKRTPPDIDTGRETILRAGGDAANAARSFGERTADQLAKRLPDFLEAVESELGPRAKAATEKAAEVGAATFASSKDAADVIRHKVDDVKPQLEDLASRARDVARHGVDEAKPRVDELSSKARSMAANAPDAFSTEFHKAEEALGAIALSVQDKTSDAAHLLEEKSKDGAQAVKQGSKDGSSLLFWVGAAASVTYFVLLSDEQREKVRHVAGVLMHEARKIYSDIQGEDGKF